MNFTEIDPKWQKYWVENEVYKTTENPNKPKYYILDMFPYPSGAGLHVGHPLGYIASDIIARYKRHQGFEVLHPMGYDAFGLPAEQFAIDTGNHPAAFTEKNAKRYEQQLKMLGLSFDWSREVNTSDPKFYKWTQWIFMQLFNSWFDKSENKAKKIEVLEAAFIKDGNTNIHAATDYEKTFSAADWAGFSSTQKQEILLDYRMAYIAESEVNWCPQLGTVLANEEVKDGFSERGGYPVEKKKMKQWVLRITAYADKLLDGLNTIDWPEAVKEMQRNWIGKSVGAEVSFGLIASPQTLSKGEGLKSLTPTPSPKERGTAPDYHTAKREMWTTLKQNARENRKSQTEAEELLWENLRNDNLGFKIRRQHPIDKFIADFICIPARLIIEVDGEIHEAQSDYDEARTFELEEIGYTVIRFTNKEVLEKMIWVCDEIKKTLNQQMLKQGSSPPSPLERGVGGEANEAITIFTTRPDTIYGATFMVLAPEHPMVAAITTAENKAAIEEYIEAAKRKSERERMAETKKISGVFTGAYAVNPFSNEKMPIWIADYVLAEYGKGAIMAVPAHDSRDYAFAKHFNLPIKEVVKGGNIEVESYDAKDGEMLNSGSLNGLKVKDAINKIIDEIEAKGIGKRKVNFRLRDANFSRQRYWGEPFPVVYNEEGLPQLLDEKDLPVVLPDVKSYKPMGTGESPLASETEWVNLPNGFKRETNTMPGWAGSSWYFLRYMDPHNETEFVSKEREKYWGQVDFYIGGAEHATGHLLYSRFWNNFLFDLGLVSHAEPFKKLINQGMIQGVSKIIYEIVLSVTLETPVKIESLNIPRIFVSSEIAERVIQNCPTEKDLSLIEVAKSEAQEFMSRDNLGTYKFYGNLISHHVEISNVDYDVLNLDSFTNNSRLSNKNQIYVIDPVYGKFFCKIEPDKMSKSKYNVVNPDELITKYGTDTFRMYEMFLGPIEQSKPWNTEGIDGVYRFLRKLWNLFYDRDEKLNINDEEPTNEELKILHKTIKKVSDDIERFNLNTCISSFMICVNELSAAKCNKRKILQDLVVLMSPFAPHISEELWQKALGNSTSVTQQPYPKYNEEYLVESNFNYPVSVNGKLRATISLPLTLSAKEIEEKALAMDEIIKWTNGNPPKKVIVVVGKIVNVVM